MGVLFSTTLGIRALPALKRARAPGRKKIISAVASREATRGMIAEIGAAGSPNRFDVNFVPPLRFLIEDEGVLEGCGVGEMTMIFILSHDHKYTHEPTHVRRKINTHTAPRKQNTQTVSE